MAKSRKFGEEGQEIVKVVQPVDTFNLTADENYDWLELDYVPQKIKNPLLQDDFDIMGEDPASAVIKVSRNPDYLHFVAKYILNVDLLPFQCVIIDTFWRKRLPILIGSRGCGKSFILAVYILLKMVLNPGIRIAICGAAFRQARQIHDYMSGIWDKAPVLRDISGSYKTVGPRRELDRCQFNIGESVCVALPTGDGSKIRGTRANIIIADEFSSIGQEVFNLVIMGFGVVSQDPYNKVKEFAMVKKLKESGLWTDEMEIARKMSSGGNQIIRSGTMSYDFNHFSQTHKIWHRIIASKGQSSKLFEGDEIPEGFDADDFAILRVPYTHVPEGLLDRGIIAQAKASISHTQFLQEYCCCSCADSDGFYKRSIIEGATTNKPININGQKIQFSASKVGQRDKAYVIGVDPAADQDNAAVIVLELNTDHRKIIYCWTTNRRKYNGLKKKMAENDVKLGDDYYRYIAKKIRQLMRIFNTEHVIMDRNGGGIAIAEALASQDTYEAGELPLFEIADPEKPKYTDGLKGLHILNLFAPNMESNVEANHGMLKDLQDKILLFPRFDSVEIEKALIIDKESDESFDTYEELVEEIEELKNELTNIVVTPSSTLGRETFDTPKIKGENTPKGLLRKDRFSALLYANYYARNRDKQDAFRIDYQPMGGNITDMKKLKPQSGGMYSGPGMLKFNNQKGWTGRIVHK